MRVKTMKMRIDTLGVAMGTEKNKDKKAAMVTAQKAYKVAADALVEAGKALKDGGVMLFDTATKGGDEDK